MEQKYEFALEGKEISQPEIIQLWEFIVIWAEIHGLTVCGFSLPAKEE